MVMSTDSDRPSGRTDPELVRQLDAARASGGSVQAVVKLQRRPGTAPDPATVESQTQRAVERATEASGLAPLDVHVLGRMAVAYVSGPESFVRELVEQPEVDAAVANEPSGG
jgi:hypothetical protein